MFQIPTNNCELIKHLPFLRTIISYNVESIIEVPDTLDVLVQFTIYFLNTWKSILHIVLGISFQNNWSISSPSLLNI